MICAHLLLAMSAVSEFFAPLGVTGSNHVDWDSYLPELRPIPVLATRFEPRNR